MSAYTWVRILISTVLTNVKPVENLSRPEVHRGLNPDCNLEIPLRRRHGRAASAPCCLLKSSNLHSPVVYTTAAI